MKGPISHKETVALKALGAAMPVYPSGGTSLEVQAIMNKLDEERTLIVLESAFRAATEFSLAEQIMAVNYFSLLLLREPKNTIAARELGRWSTLTKITEYIGANRVTDPVDEDKLVASILMRTMLAVKSPQQEVAYLEGTYMALQPDTKSHKFIAERYFAKRIIVDPSDDCARDQLEKIQSRPADAPTIRWAGVPKQTSLNDAIQNLRAAQKQAVVGLS